jgi:hypothetical protein
LKKIDLGQTVGLLANAGVIAGILLVSYELNQNREITQAQTRNSITETVVNLQLAVATNNELQEAGQKMITGETVSTLERSRLFNLWIATFRIWENAHYQHRVGLYEDEEYFAQREVARDVLTIPLVREFWCDIQDTLSPDFFEDISALMESGCE